MVRRILGIVALVVAITLFVRGWFTITPEDVAYLEAGGSGDKVPSPWPWMGGVLVVGALGVVMLVISRSRKN